MTWRNRTLRALRCSGLVVLILALVAPPALADFPYHYPRMPAGTYEPERDPNDIRVGGEPNDDPPNFRSGGDKEYWEYSHKDACQLYVVDYERRFGDERPPHPKATNCDPAVVANPQELHGVTGASVDRAWETTTGRPDVVIAVHDSGIMWNAPEYIHNLNNKTWLNRGELPNPGWGTGSYDANGDGIFNIRDYCPKWDQTEQRDSSGNVTRPAGNVDCGGEGSAAVRGDANTADTDLNANGFIDPEDLIFLFSDGVDDDGNGYVDDFVGWDSYEDDNDPFDEVQYGHGTGEAEDSTAEVNNGYGMAGVCPNCMVMHMRVGDSFIADVNDFAQGVLYATDNGASVIQSALGTLNNSRFAQEAIDYAYRRGVVLIASAADESASHHNQPSVLEHAVTMNSSGEPQGVRGSPSPARPPSYMEFRGCTNFGSFVTATVPSNSCSSEAVGRSAGMAGLAYAAARNAAAAGTIRDYRDAAPQSKVLPGQGISAEEVDQLIATTADDYNFSTPPYYERTLPETARYGATPEWDPFFGYGRINARRIVEAIDANKIPPEADITSPKWFEVVDPTRLRNGLLEIEGSVASVRTAKYSYAVKWAVWSESWQGDRHHYKKAVFRDAGVTLTQTPDDAATNTYDSPRSGTLATINAQTIKAQMDALNAGKGTEGPAVEPATGRGEHENIQLPDKFSVIVRLEVTSRDQLGLPVTSKFHAKEGGGNPNTDNEAPLVGLSTKNFFFHRDPALLPGFPKDLQGDGAAAPRYADLDDDGRDELIVATSNGEIHAYNADGSEVGGEGKGPGWPVTTTDAALNYQAPAYRSGEITTPVHAAVIRSPAIGDLDRDGDLEVVVGDFQGRISAFDRYGNMLPGFPMRSNPNWSQPQRPDRESGYYDRHPELIPGDYPGPDADPSTSGRDLPNDPDLVPDLVHRSDFSASGGNRHKLNRVIWWFVAAPTLGNIDERDDDLEILAGAADRHLYAFTVNPDLAAACPVPEMGSRCVRGWPVMLRDPRTIGSTDPVTHQVRNKEGIRDYNGAKIIVSPGLGDTNGNGFLEVFATVNEQYKEPPNTDDPLFGNVSLGTEGNNRIYKIHADGAAHGDGPTNPRLHPNDNAFFGGQWPAKIASLVLELLPVVGNGPDGAPIIGNVNGGEDMEIGIFGTAGPGYILNKDGNSIYGKDERGRDRTLRMQRDGFGPRSNSPEQASIPAVGGAIFTPVGAGRLSFAAPAAGLGKLLDVILPEDQLVSDNHLALWELSSGSRNQQEAYPREVNDLQFLATPASADINGDDRQEILEGTAYSDLHALDVNGDEPGMRALAPDGWPKFTGGWTVAPPAVGDLDGDGQRDVAHTIREGRLYVWRGNGAGACAPASWPEFGHDNWNTNNIETDAARPRVVTDLKIVPGSETDRTVTLEWTAPGDDGPCGRADNYVVRQSPEPMSNETFASAQRVGGAPAPAAAGTRQSFNVTRGCTDSYVALRSWDARPGSDTPAHPANPSAVSNNVLIPGSAVAGCTPVTPRPSVGIATTTIAASRSKVRFLSRFRLRGTVTREGSCDDLRVAIRKRVHGQSRSRFVAGTSVAASGSWRKTLRSRRNASYTAVVRPQGECRGSTSGAVPVLVRARVALWDVDCRYRPTVWGRRSTCEVFGRVRPAHPRTRILLQGRRGGRWRVVGRGRLNARSRYRLRGSSYGRFRIVWPRQGRQNITGTRYFRP